MKPFYFFRLGSANLVCVLYSLLIAPERLAIYGVKSRFGLVYRYFDVRLAFEYYPLLKDTPIGVSVLYMFICVLFIGVVG
jgi:hypothetical protein